MSAADMWSCKSCTHANNMLVPKCSKCGVGCRPRKKKAAKKVKKPSASTPVKMA